MAKQSYDKKMHETAKAKGLPLITLGYDERYSNKRGAAIFTYGPTSPAMLKKVQALLLEIVKDK